LQGLPLVLNRRSDTTFFVDSVRTDLIALLNRVASFSGDYLEFGENSDLREIALVAQLVNDGHFEGSVTQDQKGLPVNARVSGITLKGRAFADELESEQASRSWTARTAKHPVAIGVAGMIGGIAATVIAQAIIKWLNLGTP
jgi:hypothetical protein